MSVTRLYQLLADTVLFVYFAIVVFAFIVLGNLRDSRWAKVVLSTKAQSAHS